MVTIDSTLNDFMKLDYNTREMLLEIMQKRQIEARRSEISKNAWQSGKDYHAGKYQPQDANDLINKLNNL